ncbi:unnamed protein product [Malus baccata var. baccata]
MEGKQTRGRQKIEMKKIENEEDLLVSFSKRRSGVYKKATDMIALSGGEVGIVIFSPSGKPFSYGHPSVDYVINRFMNQNPPENNDYTHQFMKTHRQMKISEAMEQYNELLDTLEAVKERQKSLLRKARTRRIQEHLWWSVPIEELRVDELKQIHVSMVELHMTISNHLKERSSSSNIFGASSSGSVQQTNPNYDADPSGTDRFLNQECPKSKFRVSKNDEKAGRLNQQLEDMESQLEAEKKRGLVLDKAVLKAKGLPLKSKPPSFRELSRTDLRKMKASLEALRENVKEKASEVEASSSLLLLANGRRD